jgi:hypothetical protein
MAADLTGWALFRLAQDGPRFDVDLDLSAGQASTGGFVQTPKSLRLISSAAENPIRMPPSGSAVNPLTSNLSETGRVTPRAVRSASMTKW